MAVWSLANSSEVAVSGRIDSDFFHPEFLDLDAAIDCLPKARISKQFSISDGNHVSISRHFSSDGEIPYYRGQDINSFFLENASPIRIPESVFKSPNMLRSHFVSEDVLICIVGASTGTIGIVTKSDTPATGSCKIGIIRKKVGGDVDPFYLAAFLMGKYGQYQIQRHSRGTAQGGLILIDLMKLSVPLLSEIDQKQIRSMMSASIVSNATSKKLHLQAQQLLESELGFDKMKFQKPGGYAARFSTIELSDTFSANRIDAQCFSPEAIFYNDWLFKHARCDQLGLVVQNTVKGRQQIESTNGQVDYCSIKHINGRELTGASKCHPSQDTPLAFTNDLLLAITGATIGKLGIVKRYSQLAFSGDILRLRANTNIDPHYLLMVLDHSLGQVQFNRWITGSTNGHLAPRDIRHILVPRLNEGIEERIALLVEESITKRAESETLLEQAKACVEKLIEQAVQT